MWSNCLTGPRKTMKNAPCNRSSGHVVFRTVAHSWQEPVSFLISARPSIRMYQLGCHGTGFREILETSKKIRRENPNFRKIVQISDTLHEDVSRLIATTDIKSPWKHCWHPLVEQHCKERHWCFHIVDSDMCRTAIIRKLTVAAEDKTVNAIRPCMCIQLITRKHNIITLYVHCPSY